MRTTIRWLALGAAVLALAACSHKNRNAPLAYVPADTPYVMANLKPISDEAYAGLRPAMASTTMRAAQISRLQDMANRLAVGNNPHLANLLRYIVATARSGGAQGSGIDRHGLIAIYGLGLSPVIRGQLSDPAKFKTLVAGLEKAAGTPFSKGTLDQRDYQYLALGDSGLQLLVATHDKDFVVALLPANPATAQLRLALGLDHPKQSLQDTGRLAKLAKAEGYGPYMLGYFDTTKLPALIAGAHDPLLQAMINAAPSKSNAQVKAAQVLPAACEPGLARIAARVPRVSFGYTKLDAKETTAQVDVGLAPDIVDAFKDTGSAVPGLGVASSAPLDFALSLPMPALRKFWLAQADAVAAKPFICPALAGLNKMFASIATSLQRAGIPAVDGLRGFRIVLDKLDLASLPVIGTGNKAPDIQARVLVASTDPAGLLTLAKASMPPLQQVTVRADGKPVPLPDALAAPIQQPAWIAMNDKALAVGIGQGEEGKLAAMLDAAGGAPGMIARAHVQGGFYVDLLKTLDKDMARFAAMGKQGADAGKAEADFHARMRGAIAAMERVKDSSGSITLTDQGIRFSNDQRKK